MESTVQDLEVESIQANFEQNSADIFRFSKSYVIYHSL